MGKKAWWGWELGHCNNNKALGGLFHNLGSWGPTILPPLAHTRPCLGLGAKALPGPVVQVCHAVVWYTYSQGMGMPTSSHTTHNKWAATGSSRPGVCHCCSGVPTWWEFPPPARPNGQFGAPVTMGWVVPAFPGTHSWVGTGSRAMAQHQQWGQSRGLGTVNNGVAGKPGVLPPTACLQWVKAMGGVGNPPG